jgi:hypothetical protein
MIVGTAVRAFVCTSKTYDHSVYWNLFGDCAVSLHTLCQMMMGTIEPVTVHRTPNHALQLWKDTFVTHLKGKFVDNSNRR